MDINGLNNGLDKGGLNRGGADEKTLDKDKGLKMPLTGHLSEMRRRIFISLAGFLGGFFVAFSFSERLFELLMMPMKAYPALSPAYPYLEFVEKPEVPRLVFLAPAEAFWMHMKISMIAGLVLALPIVFHQAWKFLAPGLQAGERRHAAPFIVSGTGLFAAGAAFCYLIVLPFALEFLLNYKTGQFVPMLSVGNYMDFCLKFIVAFGIVFELPMAVVLLVRMGVVTPATLARNRKYAVLFSFVAAAVLTPTPDAFNQTLMAVPIIVLYEAGILISRIFVRRRNSVG